MSDYHDYNENLAFPPQGDWSDTQPKNNTDRTQSSCDMVDKIEKLTTENTKLKELVKELRKALQKETPALRVENAKLKTQFFLIKGLLDKWLPEFDCYNDTLTSQFCREARELLGAKK